LDQLGGTPSGNVSSDQVLAIETVKHRHVAHHNCDVVASRRSGAVLPMSGLELGGDSGASQKLWGGACLQDHPLRSY
jgi:hypothetical protein